LEAAPFERKVINTPEQKTQQEINQDIRTFKEALSGPAPDGIAQKRKQEQALDKIEDAVGIEPLI
jgi:hypothetical protein